MPYLKQKNIGIIAGPHIDPQKQNFSEDIVGQVKKSLVITMNPLLQKNNTSKTKIVSFMPSCNWIMTKKNFIKFGYMDSKMLRNEDWDFVYNRMAKKKLKMLYNPKSTIFHENISIIHFIKKRFLYGYFMWPILKKINIKNFYFFLPFLFVLFLVSFPIIFYSNYYYIFYLLVLSIYATIIIFETIRVSKNPLYYPFVFILIIIANISPGLGILSGLHNLNKE